METTQEASFESSLDTLCEYITYKEWKLDINELLVEL